MMPASLILAAALATWGPIKMGTLRGFPYPPAMLRGEQSSPAPHAIIPAPDSAPGPAPEPIVPVAIAPPSHPPPVLAAPIPPPRPVAHPAIDQRASPPAPPPPKKKPLYRRWQFWVAAGVAFSAAVGMALVATRDEPQPYTGNVSPYIVSFR